ncbi:hypothetical protein LTR70_009764 [Exophiala xenobiotica]|uniref:Uncharacterized protein n=1 Tax=Lithohypha guttulata TaxID=1690604 RepID=A0ABR0JVN0_9EURO|nr:hypothetical protein LTR24_009887 [Lithohypha guttulata]KAK5310057.1 hypothetical protein LTR70_009764 [Exophiala xenobiotica]
MQTMRYVAALCFALLITCNTSYPLHTSVTSRQDDLKDLTDELLYDASMMDFQARRWAKLPPELNWESNGCTDSPDELLEWDFLMSCERHDFGYRNYKEQGRFTDENRKRVDDNFLEDLYSECSVYGTVSELLCKGVADVYYHSVRAFGD